jgi:hypothetical protein
MVAGETSESSLFGVFALAVLLPALGFSLALFRCRLFESFPAIGTLGERATPGRQTVSCSSPIGTTGSAS